MRQWRTPREIRVEGKLGSYLDIRHFVLSQTLKRWNNTQEFGRMHANVTSLKWNRKVNNYNIVGSQNNIGKLLADGRFLYAFCPEKHLPLQPNQETTK